MTKKRKAQRFGVCRVSLVRLAGALGLADDHDIVGISAPDATDLTGSVRLVIAGPSMPECPPGFVVPIVPLPRWTA